MPRLGRLPAPQLDLLVVQVVAAPTTAKEPAPSAAATAISASNERAGCAWRMPASSKQPGRAPDIATANRHSQQLFFANMLFKRRRHPAPEHVTWTRRWPRSGTRTSCPTSQEPASTTRPQMQLTLFDMAPDPAVLRQRILV